MRTPHLVRPIDLKSQNPLLFCRGEEEDGGRIGEVDHLAGERAAAQFDVDRMKVAWAGSRHAVDVADRMARLASDPVFRKDNRTMLPRTELFKDTLKKAAHAWKRIVELRLTEEEANLLRLYVDQPGYVDLHWGMFVPAIKGQGTEEQQKKWLPLAYKFQIIGCYAQTELGHGSNVQGLETTATFDPKTDEFVIHSPTLTSSKWWPGGLGRLPLTVVYARLITEGKDYGIHGFIVQLRSLEDHNPLPGVTLGDIGGKFGSGAYNSMDNGVLRFDHVRIPRDQMLMRLSQVQRYSKAVWISSWWHLRLRCSITRLSKADYFLCWLQLMRLDFSTLQEAHACTAGLKAVTTSVTSDAIEECRKLCGGHGYLNSSGLPELFAVYVPACTYDRRQCRIAFAGCEVSNERPSPSWLLENSLLVPQLTMGNIQYLMQCTCGVTTEVDVEMSVVLICLSMICPTAEDWLNPAASKEVFNELSPDLLEVAAAHIQMIIVTKFIEKLEQDIPGEGVKAQLRNLCNVYALHLLHKHLGDFLATGCITAKQGALANQQLGMLYALVRPNAVALVDAFNYTDHYLGSVLGRYDGDVYPALYEEAWKDPLNRTVVPDGYHDYLRPLLKQQLNLSSRL
ncbi:hypothetical protein GUJ93_ZPchr0012g22070 [Zizania palustris]|uniref:Acyl-coenzyme A oxidase n=1 Tax=Zizania palustris TaxID=103762 RepID=A0A8J6BY66_ZIZPA|nr:hypothetical protein GUJ93_ZPchr0012g22070 [Zizania palustris]